MVSMSQAEAPNLCGCRDLTIWVKAQPGAASSFLAPNPSGSWLPGDHALHALLDTHSHAGQTLRPCQSCSHAAYGQSLADAPQLPMYLARFAAHSVHRWTAMLMSTYINEVWGGGAGGERYLVCLRNLGVCASRYPFAQLTIWGSATRCLHASGLA